MGYHVTDRGYWDIELFEIGILGYQNPQHGSLMWDIKICHQDIGIL